MKRHILSILIIILVSFTALAQTRTITGSGDWSDITNWNGLLVGGAIDDNDDVVMNDNIDITIKNGESYTIASLDVSKDGSLTIEVGGILIVTGTVNVDKDFTINVLGDFTIENDLIVAKDLVMNVGTDGNFNVGGDVTLDKDATLDILGEMSVAGSLTSAKDATINVGSSGVLGVAEELNLGAGSVITGAGPVIAGSCTGAACEDGQLNQPVLPITLGAFELEVQNTSILLTWTTLSELNFEYFEIQRADASGTFETIDEVNGHGDSKVAIDYHWVDENPQIGINYYRLVSKDYDGYTEVFPASQTIFEHANQDLAIYPNPARAGEQINISGISTELVNVKLYSSTGNMIKEISTNAGSFETPAELKSGIYLVNLEVNGLQKRMRLIIRQ